MYTLIKQHFQWEMKYIDKYNYRIFSKIRVLFFSFEKETGETSPPSSSPSPASNAPGVFMFWMHALFKNKDFSSIKFAEKLATKFYKILIPILKLQLAN